MSQENPNRDAALSALAEATGADVPSEPAASAGAAPASAAAPAASAAPGAPANSVGAVTSAGEGAVTTAAGVPGSVTRGGVKVGTTFGNNLDKFLTGFGEGVVVTGTAVGAAASPVVNAIDNAPAALGEAARGGGIDRPSVTQPGLVPPTTAAVEAPPAPGDEPEPGPAGTPHE